jgi:hypothetical protein
MLLAARKLEAVNAPDIRDITLTIKNQRAAISVHRCDQLICSSGV